MEPSSFHYQTEFEKVVRLRVAQYGGLENWHTHLDRARTMEADYWEHVGINPWEGSAYPLRVKQSLTGDLHRGTAYTKSALDSRMRHILDAMVELATGKVFTCIDTTGSDDVKLSALEVALELKECYKDRLNLFVGAYNVFGFKDDEPSRWQTFEDAGKRADFLVGLPEREGEPGELGHDGHIGYDEHIKRILMLSQKFGRPAHIHLDQRNSPYEKGTETFIEAVRWLGESNKTRGEPIYWTIHSISPAAYDEERFKRVVEGLHKYNIGVIVCPYAAVSMRQLRSETTPTHNSVARILEMLDAGVPVRLGSDNIEDIFVPSGTPDMYEEVNAMSNMTRFYNPDVWAKVATGTELTQVDREFIRRSLYN